MRVKTVGGKGLEKLNEVKIPLVKRQAVRALTIRPWSVLCNCLAGFCNDLF